MARRYLTTQVGLLHKQLKKQWDADWPAFMWVTQAPEAVYPWHLWLDGRTWMLFQNQDWEKQITSMMVSIRDASIRYQVRTVARRHPSDQVILMQAITGNYKASKHHVQALLVAEDDFWERVSLDRGRRLTGQPGPRDQWERRYSYLPDSWIGVSGRKVKRAQANRQQQYEDQHLVPQHWRGLGRGRRYWAVDDRIEGTVVAEDLRGAVGHDPGPPFKELDPLTHRDRTRTLEAAARVNPLLQAERWSTPG